MEISKFRGKILILGDLNINWNEKCSSTLLLKTLAQQFNLNQLITEDTRIGKTSSTLLDHIYTNDNTQNYSSGTFTLTDSDHSAIFVIHKKKSPKVPSKIIETRNFSKVNWDKLNEDLKLLDLENKIKGYPIRMIDMSFLRQNVREFLTRTLQ